MNDGRVLMVAAGNESLAGGNVGDLGEVVRDVPVTLARRGWAVDIVTPSHGFLHKAPDSYWLGTVPFTFGGQPTSADVYTVPGLCRSASVTHLVVDHPALDQSGPRPQAAGEDPASAPFATDASKYALFCSAVAECVLQELIKRPTCMHLHDWRAAFLLLLRKYDPSCASLQQIRTVYTVHHLPAQGIRPFDGHPSSMRGWYPHVAPAADLADPRWPTNLNPMAVGIRLADAVHIASPAYAAEVLQAGDPPRAYGGEGLEAELRDAHRQGRLFGILNGCDYNGSSAPERRTLPALAERLRGELLRRIGVKGTVSAADAIALERLRGLDRLRDERPMVLTSVSRVVDQKLLLLRASGTDGVSGLQGILDTIRDIGVYFLLGIGDKGYQDFLTDASATNDHFIFLNAESDECATALYGSGDLFVMPSSYEPAGDNHLRAMRAGQPCLVHGIGGLKDTVRDGLDGFVFQGATVMHQVDGLRRACERAAIRWAADPDAWRCTRDRAASARFLWEDTVKAYVSHLYS